MVSGAGPAPTRKTVQFSFAELLRACDAVTGFLTQISLDQMMLASYFARLGAVNPAFDAEMRGAYLAILDPQGTAQPAELLPSSLTPVHHTAGLAAQRLP